jgi:hypothetical protein
MANFFNNNYVLGFENHIGDFGEDLLNDLDKVFKKHGIESITIAPEKENMAFKIGYRNHNFGIVGATVKAVGYDDSRQKLVALLEETQEENERLKQELKAATEPF